MYITVTRGFFRHSEAAGSGQSLIVRVTDIERVEERDTETWVGETESRFVGSAIFLLSLRGSNNQPRYTGDGYGLYHVRESVAEIMASIRAAIAHHTVDDHGIYGAVRVGGDVRQTVHHDELRVQHTHQVMLPAAA